MILLCIEGRKPEIVEVAGIMMTFLVVLSRSNSISTKRQQKPVLGLMRPRDLWVKLSILICFYLPFWSSFLLHPLWILVIIMCFMQHLWFCWLFSSFSFLSLWRAKVRMLHQGAFYFLTDCWILRAFWRKNTPQPNSSVFSPRMTWIGCK